ncbi:MAG: OmpA family protein [Acetobacteraceae bacterium]|nr:OmpA family protein [Acetobacteraceae bacterium]
MSFRSGLLAATILAAPMAAVAQPIDGLYVGAGAGYNGKQSQNISGIVQTAPLLPSSGSGSLHYDAGWVGLASVGYGLGNGLRFEVEGSYRQNDVRRWSGTPFPADPRGHNETYGAMVNALYDFDISPFTGMDWFMPYVGVGAGYQWTTLKSVSNTGIFPNAYRASSSSDTDGNVAYQGIVGAAFPISAVPGLAITAEYRFMGVLGGEKFKGSVSGTPIAGPGFVTQLGRFGLGEQFNHSALLGVRYAFNAAPPPPPPAPIVAPAPAAARSYLVFFDWDKATLTDRARQIIAEAARNSTSVQYTRIEVNGYTDTSGSAAYNQRLSVRRAEAVAAELVRNGVPREAITTQGFGETHLLVPTGPNVREPQNRRVEIILR